MVKSKGKLFRLIIKLISINVLAAKPNTECGYKQCPPTRDGSLNVHLIAHSHMEAGWVKTFDEYYHGTNANFSSANVQLIYHSVLSELLHDRRRKFIFSETAYFWRWWKVQNYATRAMFRSLVAEGRIHFAGGGWVETDEATVDYLQILDQYTWGLRKLNDTLGPCGKPRAAWQIDSYGHTKQHASLLAQMGFDGLFIGRVDYAEKEAMIDDDRMEFMWRGSDILGKMSDIMTHTLYNVYTAPDGFCFDVLCAAEPVVGDPDSGVFNAERRVNEFMRQLEAQAKYYEHDNILVTMGGDFAYQSAASWFMNMDNLISYVNSHQGNLSDVNIFYSSPSCYLKAIYLYGRRDRTVHLEKDDHLPYGSANDTYWTGFYTSRPGLKYLAKRAHVFLQVVKQLSVLSRSRDFYELHQLRHAVSLVLHHDAITGTSLQHVIDNFIKTLSEAVDACSKKLSNFLSILTPTWGGRKRPRNNIQFTVCHHMNLSQCRFTETEEFVVVVVYNPLSAKTYHHVRLPVTALHYSIKDYNDEEVEYQLLPLPAAVTKLPGRHSTALHDLYFEAENIPPLGFNAYFITSYRDQLEEGAYVKKIQQNAEVEEDATPFISNEYIKVTVSQSTGLLESIQHHDGLKVMVNQNFYFYAQVQQDVQSGAYSFRPETERPRAVTDRVQYHTVKGLLVKEIRQKYNEWVTQVLRLYRGEEFVELEWIIGPVPVGPDLGKEVVSIFKTNITSGDTFYTDSNSRQMMKRSCVNKIRNKVHKKSIAACYYPVTSRICIQSLNSSTEMCVLTDRPQGGTSYSAGEIELMIHRRLLTDDGFGLDEPLNEEEFGAGVVVRGKHRIFFGDYRQEDELSFSERASQMSRKWTMEPWLFFTPGEKISRRKWRNVRNKRFSGLQLNGLPRHIHILTLEPWKGGSVLLRLENLIEKQPVKEETSNDRSSNSYITVDIRKIFVHHSVRLVRETTLAANHWLDEARQMDWSSRYIYPGSNDGILPDDSSDYNDNTQNEESHTDVSSEDIIKQTAERRKNIKKPSRTRQYSSYRRSSRSLKVEVNYNETINDDTKIVRADQNATVIIDEEKSKAKIVSDFTENFNNVTDVFRIHKYTLPNEGTDKPKRLRFSKTRTKDVTESNREQTKQDYSAIGRLAAKLNQNKSYDYDTAADDLDDGITKSIYEMYYERKPRKRIFKPFLRASKEFIDTRRQGNKKDNINEEIDLIDSETYLNKRRKKVKQAPLREKNKKLERRKLRQDDQYDTGIRESVAPSLMNAKKSRMDDQVDVQDADDSFEDEFEDHYHEQNEDVVKHILKKRSPKHKKTRDTGELPEQNEDFVFSLRPTQIRTFAVWFVEKKSYEPKHV